MTGTHAKLSASSAERWFNCPGSIRLIDGLPPENDDESPDYTKEGHAAHEFAAKCLTTGKAAWEFIGDKASNGIELDYEMAENVQMYLSYVRNSLAQDGGTLRIEASVNDPDFHEHFGGTADVFIHSATWVKVDDFKYGIGIAVDVEHNPQLLYYAYGVILKLRKSWPNFMPEWVELAIIQPRGFHEDGPIRVWRLSGEALMAWADFELVPAMERTEAPDAPLVAGEWCRFCPARIICPLLRERFTAYLERRMESIPHLTDAELAELLEQSEPVKMFIRAMEQEVEKRLMRGGLIPGFKLVLKKADRIWKAGAEAAIRAVLGKDAFSTPELLSPAQLEKFDGGKTLAAQWAFKPDNGLTWAKADDKRAAQKAPDPNAVFANVTTDGE